MTAPGGRLAHLDVLRGVAMLGILPVNAMFFALPVAAMEVPDFAVPGDPGEFAAYHLVKGLAEYKFISIFSFLFGAGMALLHRRCEARGTPYAGVMVRRLGVLWALGILHATLLWYGDIVSVYAPLGLALCWLVTLRPPVLAGVGGVLIVLPLLCCAAFALGGGSESEWGRTVVAAGEAGAPFEEYLRGVVKALYGRSSPEFETAVFGAGSYARVTLARTTWWVAAAPSYVLYFAWRIAGLFLIGMATLRAGWFDDPRARPAPFRRLVIWGLALGVPIQAAAIVMHTPQEGTLNTLSEMAQYAGSLGIAAAYVGGITLVCARHADDVFLAPFAAVGRTAFSNYVLQSLVMTTLFYGYGAGLGLFGRFTRTEILAVVAGVWVLELALSTLWTRHFVQGPLEWGWRCLTYARLVPLRRERS